MKRAIHPIKADMMRLHRMFPAKFGLALILAFGLLFGVFLKNGTTLLAFGNSVFGEDIGFCWNVIDPSAPDESLVRSAFCRHVSVRSAHRLPGDFTGARL